MCKWSSRSSVSARQTSPRPYLAMKLMASGVTFSAASVRSPSFSRSSSSTTTIMRPARISSIASGTATNGGWGLIDGMQTSELILVFVFRISVKQSLNFDLWRSMPRSAVPRPAKYTIGPVLQRCDQLQIDPNSSADSQKDQNNPEYILHHN